MQLLLPWSGSCVVHDNILGFRDCLSTSCTFACAKLAMTLCDRDQSRYEIEKLRSRYCSLIAFWSRPIIFGTRQASTRAVLDTPRSSHTQLTVVLRTYCPKQCILRPPHVITSHLAERQVTARHLACDCLCTTTWT